jgi:RND family efflux transporter MFP subunit
MKTALVSLMATALFLASCSGERTRRNEATSASPVQVQTAEVCAQPWPAVYEATGTVRARTTAVVSSKVMAYVQQVGVRAGDHVRAGQLLITLEARDLEANLRRAEAARTEVQSAVPEADNAVAGAKANLDLAQSTFRRMEELSSKDSISKQEFDEASARLKGAQASYEMARAKRTQLDSKLAQVEQEIRSAGIARDYATITAPFAGVVTARSVEPGNLAAPGAPLLTLEQNGAYRLEVAVDESRLPFVKIGQTVGVAIETLGRNLEARVSEIVPAVDAASRTYIVKIDLPALPNLRSGIFGRALFPLNTREVTAIPASALIERGQLQSVFVVEDGIARTRLVTTGGRSRDSVEILSGLNKGEKVVTPVPMGLADGAKVEVRQ